MTPNLKHFCGFLYSVVFTLFSKTPVFDALMFLWDYAFLLNFSILIASNIF